MVGKTPRVRKDERVRLDTIKTYCGCLPCLLLGHLDRHTTIEHVTESGRRVGSGSDQHANTIGLCLWHHFGTCESGWQKQTMLGEYGPSLAWGRRLFEDHFGDETKVLIPVQDYVLERFARQPWPEYTIDRETARLTRHYWIDLSHAQTSQ